VAENLPTTVLDTRKQMEDHCSVVPIIGLEPGKSASTTSVKRKREVSIIGLKLNILGKALNFRIGVAKRQARLADIVPLARTVCTKITDAVVESISRQGGSVQCRKGCSACCSRYLVPLSIPEALRLREEILVEPVHRRKSMQRACIFAAQRILNKKPPIPVAAQITLSSSDNLVFLELLSSWYSSLKVPCPFLAGGVCTIYKQRPLACREYFVAGSPSACAGCRGEAEVVKTPVRIVEVLGRLASELEGTRVEAVILPLALPWAQENPQRRRQTWPTKMMVERFVEIIKAMAEENSSAVTAPN
jgi:Fe-S-cluster containining protein